MLFRTKFYNQDADGGGGNETATDDFELTHDGEVTKFTRDKVIEAAQKGQFVLPKLQSEHDRLKAQMEEMQAELEESRSFADDFKMVLNAGGSDDPDGAKGREAIHRIGAVVGLSDEQVASVLTGQDEDEFDPDDFVGEDDDDTPVGPRHRRRTIPKAVTADQLDPSLRAELEYLRGKRLEDVRTGMFRDIDAQFDKDSDLAKLTERNAVAGERLKKVAREALQRRVGLEGKPYGPRLVADILGDVRKMADELGILKEQEKPLDPAAFGLGPSDGEDLRELLHQEQPPERVGVTDDNYRKNLLARMVHRVRKAGGLSADSGFDGLD